MFELGDDVVLHVGVRARDVEALLELTEAGDLFDQLRILLSEIALDGPPVLHQLLRVIDDAPLLVVIELEELVLGGTFNSTMASSTSG